MDKNGRYLLFLDLLGFSKLVETKDTNEIYEIVNSALSSFQNWEKKNQQFRTIYFSDTFIFYQEPRGYGDWAFLDVYAIGGMIFSALLAKGIPARGAISFGEFEVRLDPTGKHQLYFGRALIEAYKAEQRENWVGITIEKSAWQPYEASNPGLIDCFAREGTWIRRHDDVLLLNPFIKMRGWHPYAGTPEVPPPYSKFDAPEFPNEILALNHLIEQSRSYQEQGDFSSKTATKYHSTVSFLRKVLGIGAFKWGEHLYKEIKDEL